MKPLPLLVTLTAAALVGGVALVTTRKPIEEAKDLTGLPAAPLPISLGFDDEELALHEEALLPPKPLLTEELTPDPQLISFVETELGLSFASAPVFQPTSPEKIANTTQKIVEQTLGQENFRLLNKATHRLGFLPEFSILNELLTTIGAAEVRGLIVKEKNLIAHDFVQTEPPEQAALVNLLAQILLRKTTPAELTLKNSPDEIIAEEIRIQLLALAVEKKFRTTLPDYLPSLSENLRESICAGLPIFIYELATFAEFRLLPKLNLAKSPLPAPNLITLQLPARQRSQQLLAYPEEPSPIHGSSNYYLGPIPLYIVLLQSSSTKEAAELSTALTADSLYEEKGTLIWKLTFQKPELTTKAKDLIQNYYRFHKQAQNITLSVTGKELLLKENGENFYPN